MAFNGCSSIKTLTPLSECIPPVRLNLLSKTAHYFSLRLLLYRDHRKKVQIQGIVDHFHKIAHISGLDKDILIPILPSEW
jgi:hypothetical protein